jgi:predicted nuclease of predicted toxin-antitoxin system
LKIAFQADADLNPEIATGLRRREPAIDFHGAHGIIPDATADGEVLRIAAEAGRVLVTPDVATMPGHFADFVADSESPGVLLIPSTRMIGDVIEGVLEVWLAWSAEDIRNQIRWLPELSVPPDSVAAKAE